MSVSTKIGEKVVEEPLSVTGKCQQAVIRPESEDSFKQKATEEELTTLRHVRTKVPVVVWLLAFTGAAQRLAFYGTTIPWRKSRNPLFPSFHY